VVVEVTSCPVVILAAAAPLALADRPGAVHARLWAPEEWRVAAYSRSEMVARARARAIWHTPITSSGAVEWGERLSGGLG
jgi:hypothetical protein